MSNRKSMPFSVKALRRKFQELVPLRLKKPADMIIHVLHNTWNYRLKEIARSGKGGIR